VALFSGALNALMLTGSLYMLQVYDRVLTSRSVATLVGISGLVLAAYLLQGSLDALRLRILARIGARFDALLIGRVYDAAASLPLKGARGADAVLPLRDLDQVRAFLSGLGPTALFDMPFMPLFFAGCFLLHPWLGWLTVLGGLVIVGLTLLTERRSTGPAKAMAASGAERQALLDAGRRNAEALQAMGLKRPFGDRFLAVNARHVADGLRASDAAGSIGAAAKVFRMILQSAVLGLGAYLVIRGEMTGGAMIAASIMTSRALAPIEIAVAHWKGFVAARQGFARLEQILGLVEPPGERLRLPAPERTLEIEDLVVGAPGRPLPILQGLSFTLSAGQGLGVIGPSASGKSTLARALVGVWAPLRGHVRLDGAALEHWDPDQLARHIGYLPQDVELFDGTVAENIARFHPDAPDEAVIAAAKEAGAHEMILRLPQAYESRIGEGGAVLSGGQRQRVALARALYGQPFLVVLDEPNASLDSEGDEALTAAVRSVRARGGIVVVITHRPAGLAAVELVAMVAEGRLRALGPKDEVLQATTRPGAPASGAAVKARVQRPLRGSVN
jgi:ATP-binding cassette subfamily C protein